MRKEGIKVDALVVQRTLSSRYQLLFERKNEGLVFRSCWLLIQFRGGCRVQTVQTILAEHRFSEQLQASLLLLFDLPEFNRHSAS